MNPSSLLLHAKLALLGALLAKATPISLQNPSATFSQTGFPASATTDGLVTTNNGWAVSPNVTSIQRIWWTTSSLPSSPQVRHAEFTMSFRGTSVNTTYNIRRFIFAYTTDAVVSNTSTWIPFLPTSANTSDSGSGTLSIDSGTGKISLVGGSGLKTYDYLLGVDIPANTSITGLSVQAFPAETVVGTNSSGNFILTEVTGELSTSVNVPLAGAGATYSQSGYGPEKSIDTVVAANNGWAVAGQANVTQRIWWSASGMPAPGGTQDFDFTLNFRGASGTSLPFNLKRFILSYTTDAVVSNTSNWTPLVPSSATTSNPGAATLSINPTTNAITLSGGTSTVSLDYLVRASGQPAATITGFSLQALPVSGALGTGNSGNFILGEFVVSREAITVTVPPDITLSEGSGVHTLTIRRPSGSTGNLNVAATITGSASFPADYNRSISSTQLFSFNGSTGTLSFTLEPLADALNESPETIVLNWVPSASYNLSQTTTTITIGDTNASTFEDYIGGHGLVGNDALPDADPDSDGVPNITAYAFHLNPAGPSAAAALERLPRFTWAGNRSATPAITWMLPTPLRGDVRFTVHESTTLAAWTQIAARTGYGTGSLWTGTVSSSISDSGSPLRTVTVPASQPSMASTKRFLRLTLEKSSGGGSS